MPRPMPKRLMARPHRREGDVVWRLPIEGGLDLYLYLLVEFQSRIDWWMAVRTQVYEALLWQQIITEKKLKSGDELPPVLLILRVSAPHCRSRRS
ncbi:MAG: hypothetical protein QOJ54_649 [Aliidongia sp.]|jgi:predicted transposase YdaD|nr:hypothetical protein [Aliidongia sp.]